MSDGSWDTLGSVDQTISRLAALAGNEDARELLGLDGILGTELDIDFLYDPLGWIAFDLAMALQASASDDAQETTLLTTLVAEWHLCHLLLGEVDEADVANRVREHLQQ